MIYAIAYEELRTRVEALEAQGRNYPAIPDSSPPPQMATDETLLAIWSWNETGVSRLRYAYNLGVAYGQAGNQKVAEPAPVAGDMDAVVSQPSFATRKRVAAALCAVADQAHPKANIEDIDYTHQNYIDGWKDALDVILAIATELKNQP